MPGGVAVHRQRLLKLLTQTTREEQEHIWREIRTESELTQLCRRVEQRQERKSSALVQLVQESDHKEYIRLIRTLERRFIQQVSRDTFIEIQHEPHTTSKVPSPEGAVLTEKQTLVSRAQPVLVWLEQTLKAGKVRREKLLTQLEGQPESLRQAFLALAGDSGVFSPKSLPAAQQTTAEERLTLLVRKSSRRELEQLLAWVREEEKVPSGYPGETKTVSAQRGQSPHRQDKKTYNFIPEAQKARDTEQFRPAPRTLVRFLEENPVSGLSKQTQPGQSQAVLTETWEIRQLKEPLARPDLPVIRGEEAQPIPMAEQADLQHRAQVSHTPSEEAQPGPRSFKPSDRQAERQVPVQVQDTKNWKGTKLYSRTHYSEIQTTAQVIQDIQSEREHKSLLLHHHRVEQYIFHEHSRDPQPVPHREEGSPAASAVLLTGDTIRRWSEKHQLRRLMLEQTILSRQYLLGQPGSNPAQPIQRGYPVVLRRPDTQPTAQTEERGNLRTVTEHTINLRKVEDSTYHRYEGVFDTWTQELAHHKVTANMALAQQLQHMQETVRTLRLLSRTDRRQEHSRHTRWAQQSTVARNLLLEEETQLHSRQTIRQEQTLRRQTTELEQRQSLLQQQTQIDRQERTRHTRMADLEQQRNTIQQEDLLQRQTGTLEQEQLLHKKTTRLEQQRVLQHSQVTQQQTLRTQTTWLEQQQNTLQRQTQTLEKEQKLLQRTTREEEARLLHRQERTQHLEQLTTRQSRVTEEQDTLHRTVLQQHRDTVLRTQKVRQETAVLGQVLRYVRDKVNLAKQPEGIVIRQDATVGHQVLAKMVLDGEARILEHQSEPARTQHRTAQKRGQVQSYPDQPQAGLELRREQKPEALRETAAQAAKQVVEANIQKQSPDLRVLRRQSQEQEQVLRQQQEQIGGLRKQLEQQEALVRQSMERAVQTPEGPAQIKKIAKAVMRELEDQMRLERQRRGMK